MRNRARRALAFWGFAFAAVTAHAEPMFLSRQYTRCTGCHYSPTGGGLLTPYGRSLSREELSTTGRRDPAGAPGREQEFLWGALGDELGGLSLGIDLRPSHLDVDFAFGNVSRDFLMNADLLAAYRAKGWTVYGEIGRQPRSEGNRIDSYEYWVSHESDKGVGFRVGRFMPAYGLRLADHTAFTRSALGFDKYDQVYALELSHSGDRHLLQLSAGPGRAESFRDDDGLRAFTATARLQRDLGNRSALVVSGLYRGASQLQGRSGAGGLAFGFAAGSRVSIWTEADALFQAGVPGGPAYLVLNETSVEVHRGIWVKLSAQLRTQAGDASAGVMRWAFELVLLPRTHWNVGLSYYRDRDRIGDSVTKTLLFQLHLYL